MKTLFLLICCIALIYVHSFKIQDSFTNQDISSQSLSTQTCNTTNFEFMALDYLSKNSWVSQALSSYQSQESAQINNTAYRVNENISYSIQSVKMTLKWIPENETVSFGQNQIIVFDGGMIEATLTFMWCSINTTDGTFIGYGGEATAKTVSKQLPWAISVMEQDLFGDQWTGLGLFNIGNIKFKEFNITDIECSFFYPPCEVSAQDIFVLKFMMEKAPNIQTLKSQIETSFNQYFKGVLNLTICCSKNSLNYPTMIYKWKGYTKSQSEAGMYLSIKRNSTNIVIDKTGPNPGLYSTSLVQPTPNAECGPSPTPSPSLVTLFGTGQEFISFTVFENLLRQGIRQTQLNTHLNREFWTTKNFRYTAGDLIYALSNITSRFPEYAEITGACETDPDNLKIYKELLTLVNVQTISKCHLNVSSTKLIQFTVNLTSMVEPKFLQDTFDVWMTYYRYNVTYNDSFGFKLLNMDIVDSIVIKSLDRLYENKLFGSGWSYILGQKKPRIYVSNEAVMIYDKTGLQEMDQEQLIGQFLKEGPYYRL